MSKRILVIEFNHRDMQGIVVALERKGYKVLPALTGVSGLEQFYNELPDLIFLNLLMPDMQGVDIIRRIRSRNEGSHLPIVAINQMPGSSDRLAKSMGADGQINKPINVGEVVEIAEKYLGKEQSAPKEKNRPAAKIKVAPPPEEKGGAVPEKGLLQRFPFYTLLGRIYRTMESGTLQVEDELGVVKISFVSGLPVFVEADGFGRRLARDGRISDREAQAIRRRAGTDGIPEQLAVREMKLLAPDTLADAIRGFSYSIMRDLCRPDGGRFKWTKQTEQQGAPLDPSVVIELAAKSVFPPDKVAGALEAKGRISKPLYLASDPSRLPDLSRHEATQEVIQAATKAQNLRDLANNSKHPRENLMRAAYALGVLKVVTFDPAEAWAPPKQTAALEPEIPDMMMPEEPPSTAVRQRLQVPPATDPVMRRPLAPEADETTLDEDGELSNEQLLRLGKKLLNDKTYSKAQQCFAELIERRGEDPEVLMLFAAAAYRNRFADPQERLLDAVDALRRAMSIDILFGDARVELARILTDAGHPDLAREELREQLRFTPDHEMTQQALRHLERRDRR